MLHYCYCLYYRWTWCIYCRQQRGCRSVTEKQHYKSSWGSEQRSAHPRATVWHPWGGGSRPRCSCCHLSQQDPDHEDEDQIWTQENRCVPEIGRRGSGGFWRRWRWRVGWGAGTHWSSSGANDACGDAHARLHEARGRRLADHPSVWTAEEVIHFKSYSPACWSGTGRDTI